MAKGTAQIQGEAFESLWRGVKSRAKIAAELGISTSSVTQFSRPGVHSVNIERFESWPREIRERLSPASTPKLDDVIRLADRLAPEDRASLAKRLAATPRPLANGPEAPALRDVMDGESDGGSAGEPGADREDARRQAAGKGPGRHAERSKVAHAAGKTR